MSIRSRLAPAFHTLAAIIVMVVVACPAAWAAKVTLEPGNWGLEEGRACIDCHKKSSPGVARQWLDSAHGRAEVNCLDCHQADPDDDDAIEHEGAVIATIVSPKDCGRCHTTEFRQQQGSVHADSLARLKQAVPALTGSSGTATSVAAGCALCHGSRVEVRGDGTLDPVTWPNTGIGRINPDGSKGSCSSCHGRHRFSKAQAREPGACTWCHSGPDSPDREVYEASKHGILFSAHREQMNLDKDQWVVGKDYDAAPTCVTCHMGATPGLKGTHDVGMREAWSLNTPVSEKQYLVVFRDGDKLELPESQSAPRRGEEIIKPDGSKGMVKAVASPKRRRQIMTKVCLECHSKGFAKASLRTFDDLVRLYNLRYGEPSRAIMEALYDKGLLTPAPFDDPLEQTYWQLWHDQGTRARHGAAMGSPKDTWWEGIHRVDRTFNNRFLPQLRTVAGDELAETLIREHIPDTQPETTAKPFLGYGSGSDGRD